MENKLTEISRNDLPQLKSLYNPNESNSYSGYLTVDTYIRWFEQNPNDTLINEKIKFYCLNGDFSRGTYAVTVSYEFRFLISILFENYKSEIFIFAHCSPQRLNA